MHYYQVNIFIYQGARAGLRGSLFACPTGQAKELKHTA
jgi:hypothetical protein